MRLQNHVRIVLPSIFACVHGITLVRHRRPDCFVCTVHHQQGIHYVRVWKRMTSVWIVTSVLLLPTALAQTTVVVNPVFPSTRLRNRSNTYQFPLANIGSFPELCIYLAFGRISHSPQN